MRNFTQRHLGPSTIRDVSPTLIRALFFCFILFTLLNLSTQETKAQCPAVTSGSPPGTNGRTITTYPGCGNFSASQDLPRTGFVIMNSLVAGAVYTIEITNGDRITVRNSANTANISFCNGCTSHVWSPSTSGTYWGVVNSGGCPGNWDGTTSASLRYRRERATVSTPSVTYNCTSGGQTVISATVTKNSTINANFQWQGSGDNSTWANLVGGAVLSGAVSGGNAATSFTQTITIGTGQSPQYQWYRLQATYGDCVTDGPSVQVIPRANYTGNVTINSNITMAGTYTFNGDFIHNSGTIFEAPGCILNITATNITINSLIEGNGRGNVGGSGGVRGNLRDDDNCTQTTQANFGSGGAAGSGLGGGGAGGNGASGGATCINCGEEFLGVLTCINGSDGFFAGGGGGGGGRGGSYGGSGGTGAFGAVGVSWASGPSGGSGGSGGTSGTIYGIGTDPLNVELGSGGGGGGGGGGGWKTTSGGNFATDGSAGGTGGGGINLIATNALTVTSLGTIRANGIDGGTGGRGGSNRNEGYNCTPCPTGCCGETDCRDNDRCGVCTYYTLGTEGGAGGSAGGGSGGGIKLQAFGLMTVQGQLLAQGGNGGPNGQSPGSGQGTCFGSARAGGGGGGGRIKIILNPCLANIVSPSTVSVLGGSGGSGSNGHFNGFSGGAGSYVPNIEHPSYVALNAGTIAGNQTVCANQSIATLTNSGGASGGTGIYDYQWFVCTSGCGSPPTNYTVASGASTGLDYSPATTSVPAAYSYVRRVVSGICTTFTSPVVVTVNALPTPSASNTGPYCVNETIQLNASGGTSYSWSGPASFGSSAQNPTRTSATTLMSGTYTVTVTDANGCSNTATTVVTVNPFPDQIGPIAGGGSRCVGDATVFTMVSATSGQVGVTYELLRNGSPVASQAGSASLIAFAGQNIAGTYTMRAISAAGCTTNISGSQVIIVNTPPVASASASSPVCENATITLNSSPAGLAYTWSGPSWPGGSNAQNPTRTNATLAMAGTYQVIVQDANSCRDTVTANVSINPAPVASLEYESCPGVNGLTTVRIVGTGGSGGPYLYRQTPGVPGPSNTFSIANGSTNNFFEVDDAAGCRSTTLTVIGSYPTPTTLATASSVGSCPSEGENRLVYVTNASNQALVVFNDNGQDLGVVTAEVCLAGGPVIYNDEAAMRRSFVLGADNAPTNATIRLPFTTGDYTQLVADALTTIRTVDDISSITEIGATRYVGADEDCTYDPDPNLGTTTYFNQDGNGTLLGGEYVEFLATGFSEWWLHRSRWDVPLPVELLYLSATPDSASQSIIVDWATATETNNAGFEVLRSRDALNFEVIGWVEGNGNTFAESYYQFIDSEVMPEVVYYYRLRQIDFDGQSELSHIVSAKLPIGYLFEVGTPQPNPTRDQISFVISSSRNVQVEWQMFDVIGREVTPVNQYTGSGMSRQTIDLSKFAPGVYILNVDYNNIQKTHRVVKID
jgi:hypothetical protein